MKGKSGFDRKMEELHAYYKAQREEMFRAAMADEWALVCAEGEAAIAAYYTLRRIANLNEHGGFHFFSENTMRFFNDKLSNYSVKVVNTSIYVERLRAPRYAPHGSEWATMYWFDPESGDIMEVERAEKIIA